MKASTMLTLTSLLSIVLLSIHIAEDIVLGFAGGGLENLFGIGVLAVYLCGALLLSGRRSGLVIVLLGSIITIAVAIMHMTGAGLGVRRTEGAYFFVWTIYGLGISGTFGLVLSVLALASGRGLRGIVE